MSVGLSATFRYYVATAKLTIKKYLIPWLPVILILSELNLVVVVLKGRWMQVECGELRDFQLAESVVTSTVELHQEFKVVWVVYDAS